MNNDIHCLNYTCTVPLCSLVKSRIEDHDPEIYPSDICKDCVYGENALQYFPSFINETLTSLAIDNKKTFESLNNVFVYNGRINDRELCDNIIVQLKTDRDLQYQLSNRRMTPDQVVWKALVNIANECLAVDYTKKYTVTTEQLKEWLGAHGNGYASLEAALVYARKL